MKIPHKTSQTIDEDESDERETTKNIHKGELGHI
jgi:hypothetical protein